MVKYWVAYDKSSDDLLGYMRIVEHDDWIALSEAKFSLLGLKRNVSYAMHYAVVNHYLAKDSIKYLSSGSRSVYHVTNAQEFEISKLGFRKAYCRLNILFNPKYRFMIKLLHLTKKVIKVLDRISICHKINVVLEMEDIARRNK